MSLCCTFSSDTPFQQAYKYILYVHRLLVNCCWAEHGQRVTVAHVDHITFLRTFYDGFLCSLLHPTMGRFMTNNLTLNLDKFLIGGKVWRTFNGKNDVV